MKRLSYQSPVNGEILELSPNHIDGSWGIEGGRDIEADDFMRGAEVAVALGVSAPMWLAIAAILWVLLL